MKYIPDRLRRDVAELASRRCEYCLLDERCASKSHEIDHIIAEKHGGLTSIENLCSSCFDCNRHKGSDLCSLDTETHQIVALFHPRQHTWSDHFTLDGAMIRPLSAVGRVTVRLLQINRTDRLEERRLLRLYGQYPTFTAEHF